MYKKAIQIITLLCGVCVLSTFAASSEKQCTTFKMSKKQLEEQTDDLKKKYPDVATYYGFSSFMVRGATHDVGAYFILRVTNSMNHCSKVIDNKKCDVAAGEIIKLISNGVDLCLAAEEHKCGLC